MFAYIIIGIELAILYLIFWVVFIREPKPREIRAELWGNYAAPGEESLANTEQITLPHFIFTDEESLNSYLPSRIKIRSYRMAKSKKSRHHPHSSCCMCSCHEKNLAINTSPWRGQASVAMRSEQMKKKVAERFLLLLNRTLNTLSVKVP